MNNDSFKYWLECKYLTMAQAALLIMKILPDDWPNERLLKEPPHGFEAVFQDLLEDAQTPNPDGFVVDEYGDYHSTYELNVLNRKLIKSFSKIDGMNISIRREDLDIWLKNNKKEPFNEILKPVAHTFPERTIYSTPWLNILNAAIDEFFNPRQSQDTKKELVKKWILEEAKKNGLEPSNNIADAIFTIIKPIDHNPRTKRG